MRPAPSIGEDASSLGEEALYSVVQLRAIEQAAQAGLPPHALMTRAGAAAADFALAILESAAAQDGAQRLPHRWAVLVAAGPGNNGGDAFECAARLARHGCAVTVLVPAPNLAPGADHAAALALLRATDATLCGMPALEHMGARHWDLAIDGLFGIGLARAPEGDWAVVVDLLNALPAPVLALDVPSGLDADTGAVVGDGPCVRASHTITFIGNKPGLHTCDGRDHTGRVTVAALQIDPTLFGAPVARLSSCRIFASACLPRGHNVHKGSFGDVQIIGGAPGMTGAAVLAGHAALKMGCGRVLLGFADAAQAPTLIAGLPELMCRDAATLEPSRAVQVVGPGLGTGDNAASLVAAACASDAPLVLDADGLNLVAATPALQALLMARAARTAPTLLTPHPLEAARLLGIGAAQVQADRLGCAQRLSHLFGATVILKGSGSVIVHAGHCWINPNGNAALATGGTGDVLAGICGALLAQGWRLPLAAIGAVWIHGAAADRLVAWGIGPIGATATEIIDAARAVFNDLAAGRPQVMPDGRQ